MRDLSDVASEIIRGEAPLEGPYLVVQLERAARQPIPTEDETTSGSSIMFFPLPEGIDGKKVVILSGRQRWEVGRKEADITIPDVSVSRTHASITLDDDGTYTLEDLGSANGTMVNARPIEPGTPQKLETLDHIVFGSIAAAIYDGPNFKRLVDRVRRTHH